MYKGKNCTISPSDLSEENSYLNIYTCKDHVTL